MRARAASSTTHARNCYDHRALLGGHERGPHDHQRARASSRCTSCRRASSTATRPASSARAWSASRGRSIKELAMLAERGVDTSRLLISDRATSSCLGTRSSTSLDEEMRGEHAIGTTGTGTGPAFIDKVGAQRRAHGRPDHAEPARRPKLDDAAALQEPRHHRALRRRAARLRRRARASASSSVSSCGRSSPTPTPWCRTRTSAASASCSRARRARCSTSTPEPTRT